MTTGIFNLVTPDDLLKKLRHDYEELKLHPFDAYLAYNFFVTAESMPDWIYPGCSPVIAQKRKSLRNSDVLLEITSHLASGAKHFTHLRPSHKSVLDSTPTVGYFTNYFPVNYFPKGYFGQGVLIIRLENDARLLLGETINAVNLAKRVLQFWEDYFTRIII